MREHKCPGCGAVTRPVGLAVQLLALPSDLPPGCIPYSEPGARPDFWTAKLPVLGGIRPEVCPGCDLVSWFAVGHKDSLPRPGEAPGADVSALPLPAEE
jgi:hypothetical protein